MVISMWCTEIFEGFASVCRFVVVHIDYVYYVFILGIGIDPGIVPGPLSQVSVLIKFFPSGASI